MNDTPQTLEKDVRDNLLLLYDFDKDYDVKLLKYSENVIFKITFKEAFPVVFRIHRPGYHNIEELEGEILWMDEIHRDTDVELPVVYRGRDGRFLQKMTTFSGEEVYVSVISFLEGSPLGELKDDELIKGLESLGEITAKLHMQSINRDKSVVIKRFYWDINNLFGDNNDGIWGSWRDYKALTKEQYRILEKCTSVMKDKLNHYGRSNEKFGLIHADLHFYNVINNNGVNQIIDFDDSGYGFYMYDMGCALVTYSRNLTKLEGAWVRGCEIKSVASNTTLDLGLAVFEKDVYINFESVCSNVTIILPEGVNVACDIEKRIAGVHNLVENVDEEGIHTVYVIGKATLSKVDIIPVNFYVDDDDVEDILAEDDFDEEEAFPESGDVDVKVINKSEKEAVSEETVKSEDGFKPADNADTTEDNTETINLEEVK